MALRPLLVIAGPTASGKSDMAIRLAKAINGVIINADSRQVYKEMNIGTAKPTKAQMEQVPHFLFGIVSMKDNYNIYEYQQDVFKLLDTIPDTQVPILVGGSGMYIDSVIYNYDLHSKTKNTEEKNNALLKNKSTEELQKIIPKDVLEKLNNSDRNNPRRLQRIIERGNNLSNKRLWKQAFPTKYFVLDYPTDILKERVTTRIDKMFEEGLIEENKKLRMDGLEKYPAFDSICYKEFDGYFEGEKTLEQVKTEIIFSNMKYAKRQRTWFKRNPDSIWTNDYDLILKESQNLLANAL